MALALELEPFNGSGDQNISDWLTRFNVLCTIADIQNLDHLSWEDLQRTLIKTFGSHEHQFHPQHHQIVYDQYSSTSADNYELLPSALENEPLVNWPSDNKVWYVHEMRQQREIFMKAPLTKIETTVNEISNDIKRSPMEPMIMDRQVLFELKHIQLQNLQLKYHLAQGLEEHQSPLVIQSQTCITNWLDELLEQGGNQLVYKHKDCTMDIAPQLRTICADFAFTHDDKFIGGLLNDNQTNLLMHWDWLWPYMVP
ncbi:unnamed protein product [Didymodactylos carnosus]|uniref:Uncharacterized protein n=1 Tax=Didymodactylos carnosus TaxID=1234261 RepID=A0A8S2YGW1_9BILA|nr:unnamed protein product [Didymodactylos carnosus]